MPRIIKVTVVELVEFFCVGCNQMVHCMEKPVGSLCSVCLKKLQKKMRRSN